MYNIGIISGVGGREGVGEILTFLPVIKKVLVLNVLEFLRF